MQSPIAASLDNLAAWRSAMQACVLDLAGALAKHDLGDVADGAVVSALRERLSSDQLVLAFVAEFSRGKSELINAIFFADAGRRVLPATPGRTTMCPVEMRFDAVFPPRLSLLPIETRLQGLPLAEMRLRPQHWEHVPLLPRDADSLAAALMAVTRTQQVSVEDAAALGFWSTEQPEDNPPQAADGSVEVPVFRHAIINYPHPLLQAGLVVVDTPGLNAIGAEPELTLGLLPSAHAAVFVLAADAGVTRSDLTIWREHLGSASLERFVVLNKIDTLADPLSTPEDVQRQIEHQRVLTAQTLQVGVQRVYPLSARDGLAARVDNDSAALATSRLPALEAALATELLPRRHELLVQAAVASVSQLRGAAGRRLADRRRQHAEQMFELRGLRGKSGTKLRLMLERVDAEAADFERGNAKLAALRAVQQRILRTIMGLLSSDTLRDEMAKMQAGMGGLPLRLGAKRAFDQLAYRLAEGLRNAAFHAGEMRAMLDGSFAPLNAEFGFAFAASPPPSLAPYQDELTLIAQNYGRYLGFGQAWRMAAPGFAEQFRRLLLSKLRVVFENAAGALELWSKSASAQVDTQVLERRRGFERRREALQRVQSASGELEQRIAEVQAADDHLAQVQQAVEALADRALAQARGLLVPALPVAPAQLQALQQDAA